jgi:hypothetical protein
MSGPNDSIKNQTQNHSLCTGKKPNVLDRAAWEKEIFKNAKGRLHYFLVRPTFKFFKVQLVPKPLTCPRGKSYLVECRPFLWNTNLSGALLPTPRYEPLFWPLKND